MQPVSAPLLERIDRYIEDLFVERDPTFDANLRDAAAAGLPSIHISATEGRLLYLIATLARAARILEIGTLGGYSTTWLARALGEGGKVITLEVDPAYAAVARKNIARSVPGADVEVRVGAAVDALQAMIASGEPPFDLVFIDADKRDYVEYLGLVLQLSRPGTVILADNVIRHGAVLDDRSADDKARGARAFNEAIASHPRLESIVVPILRDKVDGVSISIVTS